MKLSFSILWSKNEKSWHIRSMRPKGYLVKYEKYGILTTRIDQEYMFLEIDIKEGHDHDSKFQMTTPKK